MKINKIFYFLLFLFLPSSLIFAEFAVNPFTGNMDNTRKSSDSATGAETSTLNAVAVFGDTTGKTLKNTSVIIDDDGNLYLEGDVSGMDSGVGQNLVLNESENGNVGIWNASPEYPLDVGGNAKVMDKFIIGRTGGNGQYFQSNTDYTIYLRKESDDDFGILQLGALDVDYLRNTGGMYIDFDSTGANPTQDFSIKQAGDIKLFLEGETGNVGIGNGSPSNKLDIEYASGVSIETFRGTTDIDITGWILYNADGEACYIYPNAEQNAIIVSATAP